MSHNPHQAPKNIKLALETLQESRAETEHAKQELLEHNTVLKLHDTALPDGEKTPYPYLKQSKDMERIARNTARRFTADESDSMTFSYAPSFEHLNRMIAFPFQAMAMFMDNWSALIKTMTGTVITPGHR